MTVYGNGTTSRPPITSPYGPRSGGAFSFHYGTDFIGYSQLRSCLPGRVTSAGWLNSAAGNTIAVESRDPLTGKMITIVRMHVASIGVRVGQQVAEGEVLGIMGKTGNASGNCDHLEIRDWTSGSMVTIDPVSWFAARIGTGAAAGGGPLANDQRRAIAVVNGRERATSQSPTTGDPLQPGAVGNFIGWVDGENVEGNHVWFKGTSGRWFWSGGFEGGNRTAGLPDLNTQNLGTQQRRVVGAGANGRVDATTAAAIAQHLPGGTIGDFSGWKHGESVEGNDIWFVGAISGNWFWSGGFEGGANTAGLEDRNPAAPAPAANARTVRGFDLNGRTTPSTAAPVAQSLPAGTVGTFAKWTRAESVTLDGVTSDVWFQGAIAGNWFAAAGFTSQSTDGLTELVGAPPAPPVTKDEDNPRGLVSYVPVYAGAQHGLIAPLGFKDKAMTVPTLRDLKGDPQVAAQPIIDTLVIHWTGVLEDQLDWFSYLNSRSSCPTWFLRPNAEAFEMIRPRQKPAVTGPDWNWRSVSVEMQMVASRTEPITAAQLDWVVELIAFLASLDGKTWDGVPVSFKINRTHVLGHREALRGGTECPGEYVMGQMDALLERARAVYAAKYAPPAPTPDPEPEPGQQVFIVPAADGDALLARGREIAADIERLFARQ